MSHFTTRDSEANVLERAKSNKSPCPIVQFVKEFLKEPSPASIRKRPCPARPRQARHEAGLLFSGILLF